MDTPRDTNSLYFKKNWFYPFALLIVLATFEQAYAYTPFPYKWADSDIPVPYYINTDNIPTVYGITEANFAAAVNAAFDEWESVPSSYLSFSHEGTGNTYTPYNNWVHDWHNTIGFAQLPAGTAGLASIWSSGSTITEVDIRLQSNGTGWSLGAVPGRIDLQSVITHEIGHLVGLGHSNISDATMRPAVGTNNIISRTLHEDDIAGITYLYYQEVPEPVTLSLFAIGGLTLTRRRRGLRKSRRR